MAFERKPIIDRFKDKVAIVTGGSSGIGRAIVEELCKEGASVAFTGISDAGLTTEREMKEQGWDVFFLQGDMILEQFCKDIVAKTIQRWGKVNYLVNNAFSFIAKGIDATTEDWQRSYFVGPVGYARMVQNCIEPMQKEGGGAIVNMSSISAHIAQVNRWTYNASKGAVNQMTKCQALDLAKLNIRVNTLDPGWVWTREVDKAARLDGGGRKKWEPFWGAYHMLRRTAEPVECAGPTLFLLSDDASFITGSEIACDGGYCAMGPEGIGETTVNAGSI
ncbi:MAG: SDR family oxidoreductase [Chitinivibrionales bacterium]|nr:SDR family oxidoreductase [Chitinivibrionales bacterium]